jgi:hypothetical protein
MGVDSEQKRRYRRVYLVEVDDKTDGAITVLNAPGIPALYTAYATESELDTSAYVTDLQANQLDRTSLWWEVSVVYETREREPNEDPEQWEPKISYSSEEVMKPVVGLLKQDDVSSPSTEVLFDNVARTPAGEPIDPPLMTPQSNGVLTIQRNELDFDDDQAGLYEDAVNSDPWFGKAPRKWLIKSITTPGREVTKIGETDVYYYPVTYTIKHNRETHDTWIANQGTVYIEGGKRKRLFTDGLAEHFLLTSTGGALPSTAAATFSRFRHRKELNFGILNLPQQFPPGGAQ